MKDFIDIQVSSKHLKLRIVAFVLALLVAVGAIGFGVSRIGAKTPGFHRVEANGDEEMILFGRSLVFHYRFSGSNAAIRADLKTLQGIYGESLKRNARLLDPTERYHGVNNLAVLNHSPGTELELDPALYAVLTDAWERTQRGEGYTVFAGAWYAEWNSILILADPQPFDPLEDEGERERLILLAALCAPSEGSFALRFDEAKHTVCLEVSEDARRTLQTLEREAQILDLNLLRDAYLLRMIAADLEAAGWTEGFLSAESGVTVALSGLDGEQYQMYALRDGKPVSAALAPLKGGTTFSALRCFAMPRNEEDKDEALYGYYSYETEDGELLYRHPNLPAGGETPQKLCASCTIGGDPVQAVYENLRIWWGTDPNDTGNGLSCAAAWVPLGEEHLLHRNRLAEEAGLGPDADYGWSVAP